jgi:tetratricopeptide (TPR) repeat protein
MRLDPMSPNRPAQLGGFGMARFQQGRYGEAVAWLKAWASGSDIPISWLTLAACHGHLGQLEAAREALARYARLSPIAIEELAAGVYRGLGQRQRFLDGIALAEGKAARA